MLTTMDIRRALVWEQLQLASERARRLRRTSRALIEKNYRLLDENYQLRRVRASNLEDRRALVLHHPMAVAARGKNPARPAGAPGSAGPSS